MAAIRSFICRVRCGMMPSMRCTTMSCPRWCISCSLGAISISKRDFVGGSMPCGYSTISASIASVAPSSFAAYFSPSVRSSSMIWALVRGVFSSAIMVAEEGEKVEAVERAAMLHEMDLLLQARRDGDVHQRLSDAPAIGRGRKPY